ncbi:MAG: hypothetical protein Ta2A_19560 [Treponemataceae bacterium]|nr:MAG: hypothetical protein Ta2A_19560 [Treponemataceae bacterium]
MIHYDLAKPEVSRNFTTDDIHKIREWHCEQLKDASVAERLDFYNASSVKMQYEIDIRRKNAGILS